MGSKTIMIQEDTYNKLVQLKQGNESFNDVIQRVISEKQDLLRYAGLLTEEEGELLESALNDIRKEMDQTDFARELGA
jgi:predicted CopG family antitoxin